MRPEPYAQPEVRLDPYGEPMGPTDGLRRPDPAAAFALGLDSDGPPTLAAYELPVTPPPALAPRRRPSRRSR